MDLLLVNLDEGAFNLELLDRLVSIVDFVAAVENLLAGTWDNTLDITTNQMRGSTGSGSDSKSAKARVLESCMALGGGG